MSTIDIVFDGLPSHKSLRFVEVERDGKSIRIGEWIDRGDGYWALRIPDHDAALLEIIGELHAALVQSIDSDDQIIMDHVRKAEATAKAVRRAS